MDWSELPDINDVYESLKQQADLKARHRIAKLRLEMYQAEMVQRKPRDSSVKVVGVDEASRKILAGLLEAVAEIEGQLDQLDANVKFNDYRREAAKIVGFRTRL